jgi:hypothetical protein
MEVHDMCLRCDHKRDDHNRGCGDSRCQKPYCPCSEFRLTTLEEYE